MAMIDIPGFVSHIKDHAIDHEFHIHDERHFIETYSMRQGWEIDLHPEAACGGPLDLHLSIDLDPRAALIFEELLLDLPEDAEPETDLTIPLLLTWELPPLLHPPDLLVVATDLAGIGGADFPLEVSALDSIAEATDAAQRSLNIKATHLLSLDLLFMRAESVCEIFNKAFEVSEYLLNHANSWLGESV